MPAVEYGIKDKKRAFATERKKAMKNKILAFLLAVCMVAGTVLAVPQTTYAAGDYAASRAVMFLTELDIMEEDTYTGEFWDDSYVKRFEIAQILCRLFDYDVAVDSVSKFKDVGDADRAYVETVVRNGLMSGYGNGNFGPNDYVTNEQIVKIFVDVIGGKDYAAMLGGYPTGYLNAARKLGISNGIVTAGNQIARRIDVANIIYNALHVDLIQLTGYTDDYANYEIKDGETLLTETMNVYTVKGVVTAIDSTSVNRAGGGTDEASVIIGGVTVLDPTYMADYYLGSSITAYTKKNTDTNQLTLMYIEESSKNNIIEVNAGDVESVSADEIRYYVGDNVRKVKYSAITDMVYNGRAITFDKAKLSGSSDINLRLVDNNDDRVIDFINVTEYTNYVVTKYKEDTETVYFDYDAKPIVLKNNYVRVFSDGQAVAPVELEAGLVASVAISNDTGNKKVIRIDCSSEGVMGNVDSVTKWTGDGAGKVAAYIKVGGKEYKVNKTAQDLILAKKLNAIESGMSGQFYLNINGEIVYFSGGGESGTVGYFVDANIENNSFDTDVKIKIYTDKGKMEIYSAKNRLKIVGNGNNASVKLSDLATNAAWIDLCNEAMGKQLIKYTEIDGIIKEIIYCKNTAAYDVKDFSLDAKGSHYVRKQGTLEYTYTVDAETKVFYVPNDGSQAIEKYRALNGSYFTRDKTYDVSLYDMDPSGKVSYAIVRDAGTSTLTINDTFMVVTDVMKGVNSDGDIVNIVEGYNTSGTKVSATAMPGAALCDSADTTIAVERGDLILYNKNVLGLIQEIKVVQKHDNTVHKGISTVINNDRQISFGYAANVTSARMLITETKPTGQISPTDSKAAIAVGGSVILYNRATDTVELSSFSEIESGDEVFAMNSAANTTMIVIIYR